MKLVRRSLVGTRDAYAGRHSIHISISLDNLAKGSECFRGERKRMQCFHLPTIKYRTLVFWIILLAHRTNSAITTPGLTFCAASCRHPALTGNQNPVLGRCSGALGPDDPNALNATVRVDREHYVSVFGVIDVLQLEEVSLVGPELGSGKDRHPRRSFEGCLVMRGYEIGRIDRVEFARFGKVSPEMGGIDLDVGQVPAMPATVITFD